MACSGTALLLLYLICNFCLKMETTMSGETILTHSMRRAVDPKTDVHTELQPIKPNKNSIGLTVYCNSAVCVPLFQKFQVTHLADDSIRLTHACRLGDVRFIVLAIGPKVRGFKPSQGGEFRGDKNPQRSFLRKGSNARSPMS